MTTPWAADVNVCVSCTHPIPIPISPPRRATPPQCYTTPCCCCCCCCCEPFFCPSPHYGPQSALGSHSYDIQCGCTGAAEKSFCKSTEPEETGFGLLIIHCTCFVNFCTLSDQYFAYFILWTALFILKTDTCYIFLIVNHSILFLWFLTSEVVSFYFDFLLLCYAKLRQIP